MRTTETAKWATNVCLLTAKLTSESPPTTTLIEATRLDAECPEVALASKVVACAVVAQAEVGSSSRAPSQTSVEDTINTTTLAATASNRAEEASAVLRA